MIRLCLLLFSAQFLAALPSFAQAPPATADSKTSILDNATAENKAAAAKAARKHGELPFESPAGGETEPATKGKYQEALREYYKYQITGLQHRQRVFVWQLVTSVAIFIVVLILVGMGVYFAAVQFKSSLNTVTQLKASLQGIEVSSSILGVIILVISLAFFYLYLVYVYPIQEIF